MKQVEVFKASTTVQMAAFDAWIAEKNIEMILCDGDDTLWRTRPIFMRQMMLSYDLLAKTGIMSREKWKMKVCEINDKLFEKIGVNPAGWSMVLDELKQYGLDDETRVKAEQTLMEIYQIPPKFIRGTERGLAFLNRVCIPMKIVTHANEDWSKRKYNQLGLGRFIDWSDIYMVNENGHKTEIEWLEAMDHFKVRPRNCLVVGDSPRADINPVCKLGVENCLLILNGVIKWKPHQQPMDETKTRLIRSVNDLRYLGKEMVLRSV